MKFRGGLAIGSVLLVFVAFFWLIFNYQFLIDRVVASQFRPGTEMSQLIEDIDFTDQGKYLFLAARPELSSRNEFNSHCEKKAEQTVVLGCYITPQNIYIYNVTDQRLTGVRQVTAAHEMLHVAYDRLSLAEKKQVDRMVNDALPSVQKAETDLAERLKVYDETEPGERNNELHSILGTEAEDLPANLEKYYAKYFQNRRAITDRAESYDKVFEDIKTEQAQLVAQMNTLVEDINRLTNQYNAESEELNKDITAFNLRAKSTGGFESEVEFNSARLALINRSDVLEAKRQTIESKTSEYETKRQQLEAVNVKVKELNSQLDSTSMPSL